VDILFECLVALLAVGLAARLRGFWSVFALSLLGAVLILHGAGRATSFDSSLPWISAAVGAGLLVVAAVRRGASFSPIAAMVGAYAILVAARLDSEYGTHYAAASVLGLAAIVALAIAVWLRRSPRAVVLAVFGLVLLSHVRSVGFGAQIYYPLLSSLADSGIPYDIAAMLIPAAWALALAGMVLFAPKAPITSAILYVLIAIAAILFVEDWAYRLDDTKLLGETPTAWMNEAGFYSIHELTLTLISILWIALSLPLAHRKLFELVKSPKSGAPVDVFISYKREERPQVERIAGALRALGLNVWFDERLSSGKSFDEEINHQVRTAKAVLVCWSPGAAASEWVRAEASIGRQRGVLTACCLERCELFPPFNLVHAEDLSTGRLDAANPAWAKLLDRIGDLVGRRSLIGAPSASDSVPASESAQG
jgi:hypothetical protein